METVINYLTEILWKINKITTETTDHMKVLAQYRHIAGAQSILILVLFPSVLVRIG